MVATRMQVVAMMRSYKWQAYLDDSAYFFFGRWGSHVACPVHSLLKNESRAVLRSMLKSEVHRDVHTDAHRFAQEKQKVLIPILGCCHGTDLADASSLKAGLPTAGCG